METPARFTVQALNCPRGKRPRGTKSKVLTCAHCRRVVANPIVVKPAAVRVPPTVAVVEAAHTQAAVRAAVDSGPEEDIMGVAPLILLPVLGNEAGVVVEGIENVRIEHRLAGQLLAKVVALERLAVLLPTGQLQDDPAAVHIQSADPLDNIDNSPAFADVLLHLCSVERELRRGAEVYSDGGCAESNPMAHRVEIGHCPSPFGHIPFSGTKKSLNFMRKV